MDLKICEKCDSPYLVSAEYCPRCPEPYTYDQDNWANVGCLVIMLLFAFFLMALPIIFLLAMLVRW
ncbi:MAG: hypothetical protein H7Z37_17145 [Pyrinomonadaceae bacterium]|nr:hypothetical protein [Pyrinomonadaceae bacterium]